MERALRVGGIGRRKIAAAAVPGLAATLRGLLDLMGQTAQSAAPGAPLVLLSQLAEGSDRLIADAALERGWRLGVLLPFDRDHYAQTFDLEPPVRAQADFERLLAEAEGPRGYGVSIMDGDPSPQKRDEAFLDCAVALIQSSDVLIAILEADQPASQTGRSVADAGELGVPVVRLAPSSPAWIELRLDQETATGDEALERLADLVTARLATR